MSLWLDGVRVEYAHSIQVEDRMSAVGGGSCVIPAVAPEALALGAVVEVREFGVTTHVHSSPFSSRSEAIIWPSIPASAPFFSHAYS